MSLSAIKHYVGTSLWFVPVLGVLAGAVLSFITLAIDRQFDYQLIPSGLTGGADGVVAILSTVALAMVSLSTLVLTITMVVVQLAMGQFSPRIVQRILQDKPSQIAIGLFVGTFVHAILSLREVRTGDPETIPGLAVVTAFVMVVLSIAVLVIYVHHIGRSLRVSSLIELVGDDTRKLLDRMYPDAGTPDAADETLIRATKSGVISALEHDHLVEVARRADCRLEMLPALGEFVPSGALLFRVTGQATAINADDVRRGVIQTLERTLQQDAAYGIRMLVDIGERSLSESPFQDPTTTVQALDRLHDCLRQLARRPFPDGIYRDANGQERLVVSTMSWEDYVHLAFDEIRIAGARSPQVTRRLMAALEDLRAHAPQGRRRVLDEQIRLIEDAAARVEAPDGALGLRPDGMGMGVAAGAREASE